MSGALQGVTVLDFSQLLQGPFATQLLGDLGADIIKIERAGSGDLFRSLTFFNSWVGGHESPSFLAWNRNKRSLALNLKSPAVHDLLMRMAERADVVVQNFRPGVMQRMGYGYADFQAVNPQIIYCSGSGYGEDGPYAKRPGQDMLIQGLTGAMSNTGWADQPPVPLGAGLPDQLGAMNMVYGILAALYHREKTGEGQEVKVNLMASMIAHLGQEYAAVLNLDRDFERPKSGIGHPGMDAPFGVYETSDGHVTIAMSPFAKLIEAIDRPDLAEYDDPARLFDERDAIWGQINDETRKWPTAKLIDQLLRYDIWCSEVQDFRAAARDPQVTHMGMLTQYEHPRAGTVHVAAPAVAMSRTPAAIRHPAPLVGQHGREILGEFGVPADEIDRLIETGDMSVDAP